MKKYWTAQEHKELWKGWAAGHSLREIGEALGRHSATIHGKLKEHGGVAPRERCRAAHQLNAAERETISRGLAAGLGLREMAREMGRSASTLSREVRRNGGAEGYRATVAERAAWERGKRPKACAMVRCTELRDSVAGKLQEDWSPQQIAGWLRKAHDNDRTMQVSHETIYRTLFVQARGALKQELMAHLRSGRQMRRTLALPPHRRGQIVDAISIRERPAQAQDRAVPGHWEGDLIFGANGSYVATLVERHSRFVMLAKISGKDSATVVQALIATMKQLPAHLKASLTWDRGTELAQHKEFSIATDIPVYFCDPRSPWQRGSNENTNGLLRQYLKRDKDLSAFDQTQLDQIARKLNTRPRQTLGFDTPAERLNACVALTG